MGKAIPSLILDGDKRKAMGKKCRRSKLSRQYHPIGPNFHGIYEGVLFKALKSFSRSLAEDYADVKKDRDLKAKVVERLESQELVPNRLPVKLITSSQDCLTLARIWELQCLEWLKK